MFDDLDETIRQLLIAEMPVKNGEVEISFDQPKREWSARQSRPTLNLFLYDVRENHILRQHQWEQLPRNGSDDMAHLKRMPFRVDCTYMLTTWASVPEDEHRLLLLDHVPVPHAVDELTLVPGHPGDGLGRHDAWLEAILLG